MHRRFKGRHPRFWGRLMEQQLQEEQRDLDRQKQKAADEMWGEVTDRTAFEFRRFDKRGVLFK